MSEVHHRAIWTLDVTVRRRRVRMSAVLRRRVFDAIVSVVVAIGALSCCSQSAEAATHIGAWTKAAGPDDTILLVGEGLEAGRLMVGDGSRTLAARVLDNGVTSFRSSTRLMTVIPPGMGAGTLWVWLEEGGEAISNTVTINAPEPWWIQPDRIDIGERTRLFGRNLDSGYAEVGTAIRVKLVKGTREFLYDAELVAPNVIELAVSLRAGLDYGDYRVYVKEAKTSDYYGPLELTLRRPAAKPHSAANVVAFGASANDNVADNAAFLAAIEHVVAQGGGTVTIPAGRFLFDDSAIGDGPIGTVLPPASARYNGGNVHLQGQGADSTVLEFTFQNRLSKHHDKIVLYDNSSLQDLGIRVTGDAYYDADYTIAVRGDNVLVKNVKIDLDACRVFQNAIAVAGEYVALEGLEIQGVGAVELRGRQIHVRDVTHRGAMPQDHYVNEDPENLNFAPHLFYTTGVSELILEECHGEDRWEQHHGAHFKRFFSAAIHWGGLHHAYVANNTVVEMKSQPFNNSGECMLFEGTVEFYRGRVQETGDEGRLIRLSGSRIPADAQVFSADLQPQDVPVLVSIIEGRGTGQVRAGRVEDGATVRLKEAFGVSPDWTSVVVVQWGFSENLIYGNVLEASNLYAVASMGLLFYGTAVDNVVRHNTFEGFHLGYSDTVFGVLPDDKYWKGVLPLYFNEISDNQIIGALGGIVTNVTEGSREGMHALGNVYRGNVISEMNCDLPQFKSRGYYCAMGIIPWMVRYKDWVEPGKGSIVGQIYESNVVNICRRAFLLNEPLADWIVLRNNSLGHGVVSGIDIDGSVGAYIQETETNVLPRIDIVDATEPYLLQFKIPWVTWTDAEMEKDYYVWSRAGEGMVAISVTDADGDAIVDREMHAGAGVRMNGNEISWQGMPTGLHVITVSATDGRGRGSRRILLFVGAYDDFETGLAVSGNGMMGRHEAYTVGTAQADYATSVSEVFGEYNGSWPHYHRVEEAQHGLASRALLVRPVNEEVAIRPSEGHAAGSDSVLSFVKNHHHGASSYVKVRIKQDDHNYYEFFDHVDVSHTFQIRRISKVVAGNEVRTESALAAHNWESPIVVEKNDKRIRVTGWGDSIELYDPQPLDIRDWEILFASPNVGRDGFLEQYAYATIDNLYFATGANLPMSLGGVSE